MSWKEEIKKRERTEISTLVDAPATESTTIVTNFFLSDDLTDSIIESMASKISSTVSRGTYNIVLISTPIASKNSILHAFSVSI